MNTYIDKFQSGAHSTLPTYLCPEPDSSLFQSLSLRLVDGGCEGCSHWKLAALPFEGIFTNLRNEGDPGNQDSSQVPNNLALTQLVVNASFVDELGSVAGSLSWVQVSQQHEWHVFLEP